MIHPSYVELMRVVNEGVEIGEEPVVNSRYSIVCAAAKRARQLVSGATPLEKEDLKGKKKPLSIAVNELAKGDLKILTDDEASFSASRLHELYDARDVFKKRHDEIAAEEAAEAAAIAEAEAKAKAEKKRKKEMLAAEAAAKAEEEARESSEEPMDGEEAAEADDLQADEV